MGSKWAHFTCLGTPNGLGSFLEKHIFDPFWTHFLSQNSPFFKTFGDFGGAKMACNGLKNGSFHLFVPSEWSGIIFGKTHFLHIFGRKTTHFKAFGDFGGAKKGLQWAQSGLISLF